MLTKQCLKKKILRKKSLASLMAGSIKVDAGSQLNARQGSR